jgi:drug/metabolite transporter (DMT)-like permease
MAMKGMHTQPLSRPFAGPVPLLVAATACWGVGTVLTKQVVDDIPPLTLLPIQLAVSCVFLVVAAALPRFVRDRDRSRGWSPQMPRLAALGVLNPGLAYALGLLGLASITASMSVLLWAIEPVLIVLLAAAVLREHIPTALAASLGIAVVGVLLIVYSPGATGDVLGIALTVAAVLCCALYSVLTRRLLLDDAALPVVLVQQLAALAFAIVLAAVVQLSRGTGAHTEGLSWDTWAMAAGSGVLYYGLAFWLFLAGLRHVPASVAGAFLPLIPVFGVAAGFLVGERLQAHQWLGAALVVGATLGIVTQQARTSRPVARQDTKSP